MRAMIAEFQEYDEIGDDDEHRNEIAKHGLLPSILDSKIWKVKVKAGMERQLVLQLMRKAIDHLNKENPFMVLTIFHCQKTEGYIFIEAHKLSHVMAIINGVSMINKKRVEMIGFKDMTQLLKTCAEMSETAVQEHQWVRILKGPYKGDLGLVEMVEGTTKAWVKLIPRIPNEAFVRGSEQTYKYEKSSITDS